MDNQKIDKTIQEIAGHDLFLGRQPILNKDNETFAYELLYRGSTDNFCKNSIDSSYATARVISTMLNNIGAKKILGGKIGFLNIDDNVLFSEIIENIPKKHFVLEILETCAINDKLLERVDELIEKGYIFALDDFVCAEENLIKYEALFPKISYLKVDLKESEFADIAYSLKKLKNFDFKLLAEKVENQEEHAILKRFGFDYYQGFYFAKPIIMSNISIDPSKSAILSIESMINSDREINDISKTFQIYPDLSINLLKFLNSALFGFRNPISSIKHAIAIIGLKQLKNWLLLLMFLGDDLEDNANPIFVLAKNRSDTMVNLLKYTKYYNPQNADKAYFAGLLSLIDVIFKMPIEDLLKEIRVDQEIKEAVLQSKGIYGDLLCLVKASEESDMEKIKPILSRLSLNMGQLSSANISSYTKNNKAT